MARQESAARQIARACRELSLLARADEVIE
jgi:hypothetical protein